MADPTKLTVHIEVKIENGRELSDLLNDIEFNLEKVIENYGDGVIQIEQPDDEPTLN